MKAFIWLLFLTFVIPAHATTYYFSAGDGNDSYTSTQAQSQATPWKTLSKLNAFFHQLKPGDSVLFKRGETFNGNIVALKSGLPGQPIVLGAYGSGSRPVISGFAQLTNWVSKGNGMWETTDPSLPGSVNILTLNGTIQPIGRYPNADQPNNGYLIFEDHVKNANIIDVDLSSIPNWKGAEVVIRKNRWILDKGKITEHSGNSLFYTGTSDYEPENNFGYFIQNHVAALDQHGEWCFDEATKKLTIFLARGSHPNDLSIKAAAIHTVVQVFGYSYINFSGLAFEGGYEAAIDVYGTRGIILQNCSLNNNLIGLKGMENTDLLINNSHFTNSSNNGIFLWANNSAVTNSTFKNTGIHSGMGKNGDDTYQALILRGSKNLIEKNRFDSIGYSVIRFEGDSNIVKKNHITNFNFIKDDGGGIYTFVGDDLFPGKGSKIHDNIVLNGIGAGYGTSKPDELSAIGIYMDGGTGSVEIKNNTVAFCTHGLCFNNGHEIDVLNNNFFSNNLQMVMHQHPLGKKIRNNRVLNNILFAKEPTQLLSSFISNQNDIESFGTFDSNYYCRPLDERIVINTNANYTSPKYIYKMLNLPSWKGVYKHDSTSKTSPKKIPQYTINTLIGKNKFPNGDFGSNRNGVSWWSASGNCKPEWSSGGGLDGGCLKIQFDEKVNPSISDRNALLTLDIGSVSAAKKYILKFSLRGTKNYENFQVYLRKHDAPYNDLSPRFWCNLSTSRTENEFLFTFPSTENSAFLVFEVAQDDSTFFVDNLEFYEAGISLTNPDDHIRFEYNASDTVRNIYLGSTSYTDVNNRLFQGTLSLAPWSSTILLTSTHYALPVGITSFQGELKGEAVKLTWNTDSFAEVGYFEIERSADGIHFTKLPSVPVRSNNQNAGWRYNADDLKPLKGPNYYRVKQVDEESKTSYSNTILIMNGSKHKISASPNPAKDFITVTLPESLTRLPLHCKVYSSSGSLQVTKQIVPNGSPVKLDTSTFSKGIYIVEVQNVRTSETYSTTIVKQ